MPLPGRTSIERCLVRHGLVTPRPGGASAAITSGGSGPGRWSCGRWTSSAACGSSTAARRRSCRASTTTPGSACRRRWWPGRRRGRCVTRWRWRCAPMGCPTQILTDNGKVFTARFGPGPGPVLFDRICRENGIKHILTAPRSPTTTGKVERWHKTLRPSSSNGKVFASIDDAQAQLDAWVRHYNYERPHQSIGRVPPWERFRLAEPREQPATPLAEASTASGPVTTRRVSAKGTISFAAGEYKAGVWLAGQTVEVVCDGGLVQLHHRGVLIATHARRHPLDKQTAGVQRSRKPRPSRPSASSPSVTRKVDSSGQRVLRRHQLPGRQQVSSAARCRSPSSATPSRSPSARSSSAATRSSTTAPANTAPSPTPAADPTASTPSLPGTQRQTEYGADTTVCGPGRWPTVAAGDQPSLTGSNTNHQSML